MKVRARNSSFDGKDIQRLKQRSEVARQLSADLCHRLDLLTIRTENVRAATVLLISKSAALEASSLQLDDNINVSFKESSINFCSARLLQKRYASVER
jgi:hypothetical protein